MYEKRRVKSFMKSVFGLLKVIRYSMVSTKNSWTIIKVSLSGAISRCVDFFVDASSLVVVLFVHTMEG